MPAKDARSELRHSLQIPIRFCSSDGSGIQGETLTEATNISRSGLFMTSPKQLKVGSQLMLVMRVPTEISGSVFSELRCMGRVIHEQRMAGGQLGYGVRIEAMASRRPVWLADPVDAKRPANPAAVDGLAAGAQTLENSRTSSGFCPRSGSTPQPAPTL